MSVRRTALGCLILAVTLQPVSHAAPAEPGRVRLSLSSDLVDTQVLPDPILRRAPSSTLSMGGQSGGVHAGWVRGPRWEVGLSGAWSRSTEAAVRPRSRQAREWLGTTRLGPYAALRLSAGERWGAWAEGGVEWVRRRGRSFRGDEPDLEIEPLRSDGYQWVGGLGARWYAAPRLSLDLSGRWSFGSYWGNLQGVDTLTGYGLIGAELVGGLSFWLGASGG